MIRSARLRNEISEDSSRVKESRCGVSGRFFEWLSERISAKYRGNG